MRYLAIQIMGDTEIQGIKARLDDLVNLGPEFDYGGNGDSSGTIRRLSQFLIAQDYIPDDNGKIPILMFGVVDLKLLIRMETFTRYFILEGGIIHNPNLLISNKRSGVSHMKGSERPEKIIDMVRKHYNKKGKS